MKVADVGPQLVGEVVSKVNHGNFPHTRCKQPTARSSMCSAAWSRASDKVPRKRFLKYLGIGVLGLVLGCCCTNCMRLRSGVLGPNVT